MQVLWVWRGQRLELVDDRIDVGQLVVFAEQLGEVVGHRGRATLGSGLQSEVPAEVHAELWI